MDLGQWGVFCFTDMLTPAQLTELAQRTEQLGYAALWYPGRCFRVVDLLLDDSPELITVDEQSDD